MPVHGRRAIQAAGLTLGPITQVPGFPVGTVVAQNPPAGTVRTRGDAVAITVLAGPGVALLDVLGLTEIAAIAALHAAGLGHTVTRIQDRSNPGKIIDQNPRAARSPHPAPPSASPATPAPQKTCGFY